MGTPGVDEELRVLSLEDDADDAFLIRRWFAKSGLRHALRWVETRAGLERELAAFLPHVVLSDYKLPAFDGLAALALVREQDPDLPFILVSGTIGEEKAVEALKSGATDYVLKDHLDRLEPVLARALRERGEKEKRRRAEAALDESRTRLQQSQKMEALGRLSGGVAHDFNNILTAITGYSELVLASSKLDEALRVDLQEILNAAFRAAALTRQLLAFSRRQVVAPKVLDLNQSLAELNRMLQRIIGEDVALTIEPAADLWRVRVDADQIGQVILNLAVNARDAMPDGGVLILRTTNAVLGEAELRAHPDVRPGRFVRLVVEDDGIGMGPDTLLRLFEPFFTTKSKDKGTGLGLATVYGIVKQSNGFIEVRSSPGKGSVFSVHLPAVEGEIEEVRRPPAPGSLRGGERILVVDDDPAVAMIARRVLERHGYSVLVAHRGEEALALCADPARRVDLLLCDVVMAQMGGPELARRLAGVYPSCRTLFVSGYAVEGLARAEISQDRFLAKPFTAESLSRKVRQVLDAPAA